MNAALNRRVHLLESTAVTRYPDPDPPVTDLERWMASLSIEALRRCEMLCQAMAADPERAGRPLSELGRSLVECACLEAEIGEADPVRRASLARQPYDPRDPEMAELRAQIECWISDPDRAFLRGTDVRGWLAWHGIVIDNLSAGELTRLAAALRAFEAHPIEAALRSDVIWAVVSNDGRSKRPGAA